MSSGDMNNPLVTHETIIANLSEYIRNSSFSQSAATRGGKVAEFVMLPLPNTSPAGGGLTPAPEVL